MFSWKTERRLKLVISSIIEYIIIIFKIIKFEIKGENLNTCNTCLYTFWLTHNYYYFFILYFPIITHIYIYLVNTIYFFFITFA